MRPFGHVSYADPHDEETMTYEIPRRDRLDLFTPAERAIWDAVHVVEAAGADVRLTEAINLMHAARARVADFVDGVDQVRQFREELERYREDLEESERDVRKLESCNRALSEEVARLTPLAADAAGALERVRAILGPVLELEAKATPGPWRSLRDGNHHIPSLRTIKGASRLEGSPPTTSAVRLLDEDADLIAATRNTLPELRAALASGQPAGPTLADEVAVWRSTAFGLEEAIVKWYESGGKGLGNHEERELERIALAAYKRDEGKAPAGQGEGAK